MPPGHALSGHAEGEGGRMLWIESRFSIIYATRKAVPAAMCLWWCVCVCVRAYDAVVDGAVTTMMVMIMTMVLRISVDAPHVCAIRTRLIKCDNSYAKHTRARTKLCNAVFIFMIPMIASQFQRICRFIDV